MYFELTTKAVSYYGQNGKFLNDCMHSLSISGLGFGF